MAAFTATVFFLIGKENSSGKDSHERTRKWKRPVKQLLLAGYVDLHKRRKLIPLVSGGIKSCLEKEKRPVDYNSLSIREDKIQLSLKKFRLFAVLYFPVRSSRLYAYFKWRPFSFHMTSTT